MMEGACLHGLQRAEWLVCFGLSAKAKWIPISFARRMHAAFVGSVFGRDLAVLPLQTCWNGSTSPASATELAHQCVCSLFIVPDNVDLLSTLCMIRRVVSCPYDVSKLVQINNELRIN